MDGLFFVYLSSGLFLGWSLGANDAANIFGTAVGTKMLRFRTAAIIASAFIILGAVFTGAGASNTLRELGNVNALAGAFMVALSAALSVYSMIKSGIPVSTSQAIVGAIVGWNYYAGKDTDYSILGQIMSTWVLCPILSGILAIIIYITIKKIIQKSGMHILRQDCYTRIGLILACAFGAYALGANNIANVMGVFVDSSPFHGITFQNGFHLDSTQILFLIGGISISCGVITYSHKVIKTVGNNIMSMTPITAWIAVVSQAIVLILFASLDLKIFLETNNLPSLPLVPVSSSQAVIGALIGIGIAKGSRDINWHLLGRIALGWLTTPIISAIVCFISLFFLENVFTLNVFH